MSHWMKDFPIDDMVSGVVVSQYVRCGKSNCRCASRRREDLHGPYHYHMDRFDGRLVKRYIRKKDVAEMQRRCLLHKVFNETLRAENRETEQFMRKARLQLRTVGHLIGDRTEAVRHFGDFIPPDFNP